MNPKINVLTLTPGELLRSADTWFASGNTASSHETRTENLLRAIYLLMRANLLANHPTLEPNSE